MSQYQQLLDRIAHYEPESDGSEWLAGALRAVVELHAPDEHGNCGTCTKAAQRAGNHVRWRVSHPCETVQAIARELGIEAGDGRG